MNNWRTKRPPGPFMAKAEHTSWDLPKFSVKRTIHYYIVEHLWRFLRALFIMLGTWLWLYVDSASPHLIIALYGAAAVFDQLHGYICKKIEIVLHFDLEHNDYE